MTPSSAPQPDRQDPTEVRERTLLAWQRTVLAATGVSLVQLRLTVGRGSTAALAVIVLGGVLGLLVLADSVRRQREVSRTHELAGSTRGGVRALVLAVAVTLLLATELGVVLSGG